MDMTDEELDYERLRRNFIKYTQVCGKGKEVSFDIYKNIYDDLCRYMDLWNNAEEKINLLERIISEMAEQLTSPVNGKDWVIQYYKDKVEKQIELENKVNEMLE